MSCVNLKQINFQLKFKTIYGAKVNYPDYFYLLYN